MQEKPQDFLMPIEQLRKDLEAIKDIDSEIVDYLAIINSYKGVWTLSSCAGHKASEIKAGEKHPGRTLYPWLDLRLDNRYLYYPFCKELAPVEDDSSYTLTLSPYSSSITIESRAQGIASTLSGHQSIIIVPEEKLASVRKAFFERIIQTLENVVRIKAEWEEIRLKKEFLNFDWKT